MSAHGLVETSTVEERLAEVRASAAGTPPHLPECSAATTVAAVYSRVSSEGQEQGTSLDTQEAACCRVAAEIGLTVPSQYIFRETASGAALGRPVLEQVRSLVRDRLVGAVVCYSSDRLSRDPMQLLFFVDEVLRAGAKLHFVTEDLEDSDIGRLILHVRGFAAALERQRILERTTRGKKAKLQAGKLLRARALYGYLLLDSGKRAIVPAQAAVVTRIFSETASGTAIRAVAAGLSTDGIPSPMGNASWGRSTVIRILHEEAYRGLTVAWKWRREARRVLLRPEEEWIALPDGTTPRLVSDEVWFRVQAQLERNREVAARNLKHFDLYLLRGHIDCGHCGFPMWGELRFRYGHWVTEYRCRGRTGHVGSACRKGEGLPSISGALLDHLVWERVSTVLADPDLLEREVRRRAGRKATDSTRSSPVEKELAAIRRGQQHLAKAISSGQGNEAMVDQLAAELRSLHDRERVLRDRLAVAQASDRVREKRLARASTGAADIAELTTRLAELDFAGKRLALEALGARLDVFRTGSALRSVLHLTLPGSGSPGIEQSVAVGTGSGKSARDQT